MKRYAIPYLLAVLLSSLSPAASSAPKESLSPDEISGLKIENAECDKRLLGKVEQVLPTKTKSPDKQNVKWIYKVRLANNKLIDSLAYWPVNDSPTRYVGQIVCAEDRS